MKELRLFLRKIDQKVISKGKHYLLTDDSAESVPCVAL